MSQADRSEIERMLRLCDARALPEVTEGTSYGAPALKVRGKAFASVRGPGEMVLHCPHEHKELLLDMAPEIYWQTPHFHGWPAVLVRYGVADPDRQREQIEKAWARRATQAQRRARGLA